MMLVTESMSLAEAFSGRYSVAVVRHDQEKRSNDYMIDAAKKVE